MEIFDIENIDKKFNDNFVLENFSLKINEGDKVNISGKSGIGKTTLFRLLLGLEMPDNGVIKYKNENLENHIIWKIRREVAYVSQDLNIGRGNVRKFFNETIHYKANQANTSFDNIYQLLEKFDLGISVLDKNLEELSGGEKQRIAIINAINLGRRIFLLDEITSALDNELKKSVMIYFIDNKDYTVIYISHDSFASLGKSIKTIYLG